MNARYIIGTGWWCAETTSQGVERPLAKGSDIIRSQPFHHLWHASISEFTDPCAIIMIDSASPVPPPLKANSKLHVLSLLSNPGHSSQCTTRYCGWTASVLLGVEYALMCNVEYYVYVEQDVLLKGKNIVERCIERMTTPYMFGDGTGTPQPIQQSLFIIRRDGMPSFLSAMHGLKSSDSVINPEWKFQIATSPFLIRFPEQLLSQRKFRRFYMRHQKKYSWRRNYDVIPFGYGRNRPIDFDVSHFYFQHASINEIRSYLESLPPLTKEKFLKALPNAKKQLNEL